MGQIEPGDRKEMLLTGILNGDTETNIEPGDREEMLLAGILSGATESNIEPGSRKEALLKAILENGGGGGGGGKVEESWHQCPETVRNYIVAASAEYSPNDYTETVIDDYAPAVPLSANTKPGGKTIDGVTFKNNEPNVAEPFATANKAGTLTALDSLRWVNTSATMNVRDLGGWACDGGTVRYGKLFRGGVAEATDKELMVDVMGVKHELDLRGDTSVTSSPWGIGYTVFDEYAWYSIANKSLWTKMLRCVFDNVSKNIPLYFHCAAGADRTGTLACVLEAILGVSQTDIDIDYELTTFATGSATADTTRARNETSWTGLINEIKAVTLPSGVSDTFRNHAIYFVASLGFTADEINAFRAAMIDGEPDAITLDLDSYTVTKTLTNVTATGDASVDEYQPYESILTPSAGYILSGVSVTMDGADITDQVFSGEQGRRRWSVSKTLSYCSSSSEKWAIEDGDDFVTILTADAGYTLDGATVQITMGGVDVSTYYSNGKIAIPNVSGDIAITATAVVSNPYQRCAYIETSALDAGYVDTGYTNTENTGLEVKVQFGHASNSGQGMIGNDDWYIGAQTAGDMRAFKGGIKSYQLTNSVATDTDYTVSVNKNGDGNAYINGTEKAWNTGTPSFNKASSIYLMQCNNTASGYKNGMWGRLYAAAIYENGVKVKEYVPCYRVSDGVCGVYETISDTFIAGTGTFTHGADVN